MLRSMIVAGVLFGAGCIVIEGSRVGQPPNDKDAEKVAMTLSAKVPASIERHTQVPGWVRDRTGYGTTRRGSEWDWSSHFAVRKPGAPESQVQRLPFDLYAPILTPIRADVLAAVESTGVEVTWTSPIEFRDGPPPQARFEVRYLRQNRTVAGEVVGLVELATVSSGADTRYTDAKVILREWTCK